MKLSNQSKLVTSLSVLLAVCSGSVIVADTGNDDTSAVTTANSSSHNYLSKSLERRLKKDERERNEEIEQENREGEEDQEDKKVEVDKDLQVNFKITPATTPGPLNPGRLLAAQCSQCHGTDGASHNGIDSLAGEPVSELINEMIDMKNDNDHDMMHLQARGYSNEQIRLIAEYFASLPAGSNGND